MNASQIRDELLQQHKAIRSQIEEIKPMAQRARDGAPVREELALAMARLAKVVEHHNAREEELLGDLLRSVDAWGWVRTEMMTSAHANEHNEIHATLVGVLVTVDEFAGSAVHRILERLLEHMAREEKMFLNADSLRDDQIAMDAFDG
jgi:hypothetical protein